MLYDKDIREPLFDFLEESFGKSRIIEEKSMGRSRADIVMVLESAIVGLEIKSDADSYTRLESQVKDYDKHFDYNIVVVGTSHALHIREHVPEWWGIITVEEIDGKADFYMYRRVQENPQSVLKNQLSFLWREELARIQERNGMYRYKEKSKQFVRDKIFETVPGERLKLQLCEELFERDYSGIAERITAYRKAHGRRKRRKRNRNYKVK
ncbi:MAG: sce7726 family protein [Eubacteriales bacterium]|nr:sce7726 family protein [Eubacteriales bacterium]